MAAVAQQLGMSERSFKRHLAQEDTTFGEILDRLRNNLARRCLEDQHMTLQQIAWLLGYSEIGAFNHAFKRWTGTSPGRQEICQPYRPLHRVSLHGFPELRLVREGVTSEFGDAIRRIERKTKRTSVTRQA
jgi:AraC-like DNA-binding protein